MAFNPAAETARYIDALGPEALQKAADYTSATHWMLLWGLLVSAVVTWIIVRVGILDKVSAKLDKRGWGLRIAQPVGHGSRGLHHAQVPGDRLPVVAHTRGAGATRCQQRHGEQREASAHQAAATSTRQS